MPDMATPEFLAHLKALYPVQASPLKNPWAFVAAVAYSTSNLPEAIPLVFQHALKDISSQPTATKVTDQQLFVRKMKDALFKSGMLSGYPKVCDFVPLASGSLKPKRRLSMLSWLSIMHYPRTCERTSHYGLLLYCLSHAPNSCQSSDFSLSTDELSKAGRQDFERTYGDTASTVQALLDDAYPDLGKS
jgi:hypothetical protein